MHSTMSFSPLRPSSTDSAKRAAAYACNASRRARAQGAASRSGGQCALPTRPASRQAGGALAHHGQRGGAGAGLGLDDLSAGVLDALGELGQLLGAERHARGGLRAVGGGSLHRSGRAGQQPHAASSAATLLPPGCHAVTLPHPQQGLPRQLQPGTRLHGSCPRQSSLASAARTWDNSGRMVSPAWPPMTGTLTLVTSRPLASATNVLERTMSSVVTPITCGMLAQARARLQGPAERRGVVQVRCRALRSGRPAPAEHSV